MNPTDAQFRGWAERVAAGLVRRDHPRFDDMVQEALIERWRAHCPAAAWKAARLRMLDILTENRPPLGGDSMPGPKYRPATIGVDWTDPVTVGLLGGSASAPEDYPEVRAAVRALPERDRELVYRRFWLGEPWRDKAESNRFTKYIRPALREALAGAL